MKCSTLSALRSAFAMTLVVGIASGQYAAQVFAEPKLSNAKVQDFRQHPLENEEQLTKGLVTPLLDNAYLAKRLRGFLLASPPPFDLKAPYNSRRSISYHLVVNLESYSSEGSSFDFHWPGGDKEALLTSVDPLTSALWNTFISAIVSQLENVALLSSMIPVDDPNEADVLIYVNLAERVQTSKGFGLMDMPQYPKRKAKPGQSQSNYDEFWRTTQLLPWAVVNSYSSFNREPAGGEVWLSLPIRTFWQAHLAKHALSDTRMAQALGLGSTRREVLETYRTAQDMELLPLMRSLDMSRPRWPSEPRPAESVLSAAIGLNQWVAGNSVGIPTSKSGFSINCAAQQQAQTIAERLGRAMAVFSAIGAGRQLISYEPISQLESPSFGSSEYAAEFFRDQSGFLARGSLADFSEYFDQRIDDKLSLLVLKRLSALSESKTLPDAVSALTKGSETALLESSKDEVLRMIKDVAIEMQNDSCIGRDQVVRFMGNMYQK